MRVDAVATVLVVAAALGACSSSGGGDLACGHFHNVAVDASDGVLTDTELRQKLKEVADAARGTDVEDEARALLAEATSGGEASFTTAVRSMTSACDEYR